MYPELYTYVPENVQISPKVHLVRFWTDLVHFWTDLVYENVPDSGLTQISFVRITNPNGSGVDPEIDALADVKSVPEPSSLPLVCLALGIWYSRISVRVRPGSRSPNPK